MRVKWAEDTPERAWVELRVRLEQALRVRQFVEWLMKRNGRPAAVRACDTFWGSHGCELEEDHDGAHWCCCECVEHPDPGSGCVGTAPYYGPETRFYHMGSVEE